MKLTKYEHACVVLEDGGHKLVIDPGAYAASLPALEKVAAVVVTHQHPDHLGEQQLAAIVEKNPDAQIFAPADAVEAFPKFKMQAVKAGDELKAGPFKLRFYGSMHADIHPGIPVPQNVGVLVNDDVYYPGDSFDPPAGGAQAKTLLVPVCGPWLKLGEAIDMVVALKPAVAIPTHEIFYIPDAQKLEAMMLQPFCDQQGTKLAVLQPGQSTEV